MSDATHEREVLEEGTATEFWRVFGEYAVREWGPAGLKYQQAVRAAAESPNAVIELQKVLHTQQEILALMRWPHERLTGLKSQLRHPAEFSPSRRGPGL